ncbi:GlxA family transcriptional regulator [Paenirhodobacter sp.]|uniref:GlxA family transcriptional regulator n=1 Tax=Paenirhodobacter sp. TaxID=1965326 RepID=UPI003B3E8F5B
MAPQHFIFALVEDFTHLAFACAVDPLRIANLISGRELYRWSYASRDGRTATSSDGTVIMVQHPFDALPPGERLFVLSGLNMQQKDCRALIAALRKMDRGGRTRIGALCSGAWVLAKAGLLNGRAAAIHWEYHDSFRSEFPDVDLVPNVFVAEGRFITASGGTATADLMLNLIERDHGYDLAVAVSDQMVYNAVRSASSAQKVSLQARAGIRNAHLVRAIGIMRANLDAPLPQAEIARQTGISARQLERLFGKLLNKTPKRYYLDLRLEKARYLLLQTEMSVTDVALSCGFDDPGSFSRAYRAAFGIPPRTQRGRIG